MVSVAYHYFYEAARCGSMRLASEKIGVAVSSISRQIAQLEQEVGIALLEKNRRSIRLTEAGRLVYEAQHAHIMQRQVLAEQLDALRGVRQGIVRLAVGEGFIGQLFIDLVAAFRRDNPGIELSILVESTADAVRHILEDEIDVALVFQPPAEPRLRVRSTVRQPLHAVCRPDHPLAAVPACSFDDLARHSLALMPRGTRLRDILADTERKRGIWLNADVVSNSILALRELARTGEAVTILPLTSIVPELQSGVLVALPIAEPDLQATEIAIVTRLGRQLGDAPARILPLLESKLRAAA